MSQSWAKPSIWCAIKRDLFPVCIIMFKQLISVKTVFCFLYIELDDYVFTPVPINYHVLRHDISNHMICTSTNFVL